MKKILIIATILVCLSISNINYSFAAYDYINNDTEVSTYVHNIEQLVKSNWKPPRDENTKKAIVEFTITKEGQFVNPIIKISSGNIEFDESIIKAVNDTAAFKPLPQQLQSKDVIMNFTFDYNVIEGNNYNYRNYRINRQF